MLIEDKIALLEENVSVLNTEITALRLFILEQLLVIKKRNSQKNVINRFINIPIKIVSETK